MKYLSIPAVIVFFIATFAGAQTTINGDGLALRSSGFSTGGANNWTLNQNGYVGTYLTLASPGQVTIDVEAFGQNTPHMNIVLNDTKAGFDVAGGFNNYQYTFDLPAGTHLLRTEMNNDGAASPVLTIRELTVTGATVSNVSSDANALNAADTYIQNYRRGGAQLQLVGIPAGTPVDIRLKTHAFNFGTAVNDPDDYLATPTPGSDAAKFQDALVETRMNTLTPENSGKWESNSDDNNPNVVTMGDVDQILDFAEANDMRVRMHNLIWGPNNQQPGWVVDLLNDAGGGDMGAADDLRSRISDRIDYYVGDGVGPDRAQRYVELDVYNESWHTGVAAGGSNNYAAIYGPDGVAGIYDEVAQAVADAGAETKLFANEYNVLQDNSDFYGNWYRQHIEIINNAGFGQVISGIGVQSYENFAFGTGQNAHVPSRITQVLQNLSVLGLPITLTEYGVKSPVNQFSAADMMEESMRLVFGTPEATGFIMWGIWSEDIFHPAAALYDDNWDLTIPGQRWIDLMTIDGDANPYDDWDTELSLLTGPGGIVDFTGFYGDYEVAVGGETYDLTLSKGVTDYQLILAAPPGDADGDGDVDLDDYNIMSGNMYAAVAGGANDGDFDDDGDVDFDDFIIQALNFGQWPDAEETLADIPEPATAFLLLFTVCARLRGLPREPRRRDH